ncbi:hypothetical protein BB561_004933 [Smittium simulii]|uniref:Uncharacterized protein n=1 Tax=Smittium simulii TaxID=133385 RepID=A0A2T9YD96_9FUNG|nr:hypothetical protein BB561_004933 [Smittium simulii]
MRADYIYKHLNPNGVGSLDNSDIDRVMIKEAKLQILLHLYVLSDHTSISNELKTTSLSEESFSEYENTVISTLNYYFDQLCIYSSLDFLNDHNNAQQTVSKDATEDFLNSLPVLRFRKKLGPLIDSLYEKNGFILPVVNGTFDEESPFLNSNIFEHKLYDEYKSTSKEILADSEVNYKAQRSLNTKRKGTPKKISNSLTSSTTEFLISPSRSRKIKTHSKIHEGISSTVQTSHNLGLESSRSVISNKKLARHSSSNIQRFKSLNNVKYNDLNSINHKKNLSTSMSIGSGLFNLNKLNSREKYPINIAGRRSSERVVSSLKQKLKSEVYFSTNSKSPNLNKESTPTNKLKNTTAEIPSNPFLNSSVSINNYNATRILTSGLQLAESKNSSAKLSSRNLSAPGAKIEAFEVQETTINRSLRRKERFSTTSFLQKISNSSTSNIDSESFGKTNEATIPFRMAQEKSKSLNNRSISNILGKRRFKRKGKFNKF